jgi:hypothetical protein
VCRALYVILVAMINDRYDTFSLGLSKTIKLLFLFFSILLPTYYLLMTCHDDGVRKGKGGKENILLSLITTNLLPSGQ